MIVERLAGTAADLHGRAMPSDGRPRVTLCEVAGPAVVLGSSQDERVVDAAAAGRAGVEVARRRGGGGAVWLEPDGCAWFDVFVPAGDPRWDADVGRAFLWLGDALAEVVRSTGEMSPVVHRGPMVVSPAGAEAVCFGGLGPGEVTVDGRKLLGISQRRTREGARFQCVLYDRWDAGPLLGVLTAGAVDPEVVATVGIGSVDAGGPPAVSIRAAVAEQLSVGALWREPEDHT